MDKTLYYLHALSALHLGIGQGSGVIDLPIARERASYLPQVPGSSIKGVLRYENRPDENDDKELHLALFGPESGEHASEFAGSLAVGDGRLLALPVRSWKGTFAWATCPLILRRYQRDLNEVGAIGVPPDIPRPERDTACCPDGSDLQENSAIYLEDLDLKTDVCNETDAWADWIAKQFFSDREWQNAFKQHFLILPDNLLDFLSETATEIRTRVHIDPDTNTVQDGQLWTEEYLPAETLLWGILACDRARNGSNKSGRELLDQLQSSTIQLGGNATTGGGQTRWIKREMEA